MSDKKSFHSFRYNFEDACRNGGTPREQMDALQDHSFNGMADVYGSGYSVKVLHNEVLKVNYDGLWFL